MELLRASQNAHVDSIHAFQVEGSVQQHIHQGPPARVRVEDMTLFELLQPIGDASHARDRKRSPPDSACLPGTRLKVIAKVEIWASSTIFSIKVHVYWMHGYVGCGKSAIALEVCERVQRKGRLAASFFFFRNAGDRARIHRLATTLASQMAESIPETAPFIRQAIIDNPNLVKGDGERVSLAVQMERLVYGPLRDADSWGSLTFKALIGGPYLIVLDGLDECEDRDEVRLLIDGMITFFRQNPRIPLRIFITSRVELHIQSRLNVPEVLLDNLVDHCSDHDIATFLRTLFQQEGRHNPVVAAYIRSHGAWPTLEDRRKLVKHIGKSFLFASVVFRFIVGSSIENDHRTPMERLTLALDMNPGLDGLYMETLARSEKFPHFSSVISTIALTGEPLSTAGIAELLEIETYEVVNVLVNLQAVIQLPGTDDMPVTLCHTSLRDFLTTESRSGRFFVPPKFHFRLFLRCFTHHLDTCRPPKAAQQDLKQTHIGRYCEMYSIAYHWGGAQPVLTCSDLERAIPLLREAVDLSPLGPEPPHNLGMALRDLFVFTKSLAHIDEAIVLHRQALELTPSTHLQHPLVVASLANALLARWKQTDASVDGDYQEAIDLCRRELITARTFGTEREVLLERLAESLREMFNLKGLGNPQEVVSLYREVLTLPPSPDSDRPSSLHKLGKALQTLCTHTRKVEHQVEAVAVYREALGLLPYPKPGRPGALGELAGALLVLFKLSGSVRDIEEAISLYREALSLRSAPHPQRPTSLSHVASALCELFEEEGHQTAYMREAISLHHEALELRPAPHPKRYLTLQNLANALIVLFDHEGTDCLLEDAISRFREALDLCPPRPNRVTLLVSLGDALRARFHREGSVNLLYDAIALQREAQEKLGSASQDRFYSLNSLANSLSTLFEHEKDAAHIEEAISLYREVLKVGLPFDRDRGIILVNLGDALRMRGEWKAEDFVEDYEEAIALHREAGEDKNGGTRRLCRIGAIRHQWMGVVFYSRFEKMGVAEDLDKAIPFLRKSLDLYHSTDVYRPRALTFLIKSVQALHERDGSPSHLEEAIALTRELLSKHYIPGHWRRGEWVNRLLSLVQMRVPDVTGNQDDLGEIAKEPGSTR
ncbi:hypothetical protein MD484_g7772, partial [Candolleomyces efflorescens]